jgi:hypothetical protein
MAHEADPPKAVHTNQVLPRNEPRAAVFNFFVLIATNLQKFYKRIYNSIFDEFYVYGKLWRSRIY